MMNEETMKEFVIAVAEMRTAQRDYFKTRSKRALEISLRMERRVDALTTEARRMLRIEANQRAQGQLPF